MLYTITLVFFCFFLFFMWKFWFWNHSVILCISVFFIFHLQEIFRLCARTKMGSFLYWRRLTIYMYTISTLITPLNIWEGFYYRSNYIEFLLRLLVIWLELLSGLRVFVQYYIIYHQNWNMNIHVDLVRIKSTTYIIYTSPHVCEEIFYMFKYN